MVSTYGVRHILKLEPMQFARELNVRHEMKRELKGNTHNFHLINLMDDNDIHRY